MKSASPGLIALLTGNQFLWADCFTFTCTTGNVIRWTSADGDLTLNGHLFSSLGTVFGENTTAPVPIIKRSSISNSTGLNVDVMKLEIMNDGNTVVPGTIIDPGSFASVGGFDGATVQLERTFMPVGEWGNTTNGSVILFLGKVADVTVGRTKIEMAVKSMLMLLDIHLPRNKYQANCNQIFCGPGCTILESALGVSFTESTDTSLSYLAPVGGITQPTSYFTFGKVTFTSGINQGLSFTLSGNSSSRIYINGLMRFYPQSGDTFIAYPGCDHTLNTCKTKFYRDNSINFRGFPFIPVPESSL